MDKEAEANGKDGQEANGETESDIVESEFTEKREGRKVIILVNVEFFSCIPRLMEI